MKKTWKHINFEQRKLISSGITRNDKLIETAERLGLDSRSISIEVRRNRVPVDFTKEYISKCPNFNRWSLVCTKCKLRYSKDCCYKKFKYDARTVQRKADANLINLRKGIDLDSEEFKKLDSIIKKGIDEKKSIYQIKTENNNIIDKSITTLYKYVNKDYLSTKRIDLPYTIKLKKKYNKKDDYFNHTYLDYLSYIHKHPGINAWQLNFLGTIKSDSKNIYHLFCKMYTSQ